MAITAAIRALALAASTLFHAISAQRLFSPHVPIYTAASRETRKRGKKDTRERSGFARAVVKGAALAIYTYIYAQHARGRTDQFSERSPNHAFAQPVCAVAVCV